MGLTYLTNHPTDFLSLSISQKILDIICNFCIHDDMYTEPQIYHLSFDIKSTKNSTEYNNISNAIQSIFDKLRLDNRCIDILESSYLIFTKNTEEEIVSKLVGKIKSEGGNIDKFHCFISKVNNTCGEFNLSTEIDPLFSEWVKESRCY
ncbi:hypothetical protein [Akkermansia sp. AKK6]